MKSKFSKYIELTKPKIAALNVLVAIVTMVLAKPYEINLQPLLFLIISGFLSAGGAATINCYLEKDLDAKMIRTKKRTLPSGLINPSIAFIQGLLMLSASLIISWFLLNPLTSIFIVLGAFTYIGIYTIWLKKRTSWNIVIGGAAGSFAPLAGWSAVTNAVSLEPVLLAILIFLWTPGHFWALACTNKKDYSAANIPMMPVLVDWHKSTRYILYSNIILVLFSLTFFITNISGIIFMIISLFTGLYIIYKNIDLVKNPNESNAWSSFKASSPYLIFILVGLLLDKYLMY